MLNGGERMMVVVKEIRARRCRLNGQVPGFKIVGSYCLRIERLPSSRASIPTLTLLSIDRSLSANEEVKFSAELS